MNPVGSPLPGHSIRVLITGGQGQVGRALLATAPREAAVRTAGHDELDLTRREQIEQVVGDFTPDLVINAAAHTAVDRAESEPEQARMVNTEGAGYLASAAAAVGARMIQLSTDFVFDGYSGRPYTPLDEPNPVSIYGATKLAGERAVLERLGKNAVVVRTAWVYASKGHNFALTMLRLMCEHDRVTVVCDQIGTPTWATSLAQMVWRAASRPNLTGVLHCTDAGIASRYDFAIAVQEEALVLGLLPRTVPVVPIRTAEYPSQARRPAYGVLDCSAAWALLDITPAHWRINLRRMLSELHGG